MSMRRIFSRIVMLAPSCVAILAVALLYGPSAAVARPPQGQSVLLPENSVNRVSDHVYVIMGFPNIGIIAVSYTHLAHAAPDQLGQDLPNRMALLGRRTLECRHGSRAH